ncbi:MAG: hypothetical protein HWN70_12910 [Desulfobacterales bacterium]|nr:hypothetical protein [Desulfobacterales bacterium]
MKRYRYPSGLLLSPLLISASCSSLTLNIKDRSPATEQSTLALLWLWLLARFYGKEKRRRVLGWQLADLALPKIINDNATQILNHHHPSKKVTKLEDWKE